MSIKGAVHEVERPAALPAKAATADLATLVDQLVKLGLDFAAEALPAILTRAVKEDMGSPALLEQLLRGELERREERRVRTSLRLSGLPKPPSERAVLAEWCAWHNALRFDRSNGAPPLRRERT